MTCLATTSEITSSICSSSSSSMMKKNVSFNGRVRIRSVPSLDDFSKAECDAAWYSCQDFQQIKSRERRLRDESARSASLQETLRKELGMETPLERRLKHSRIDVGRYSVICEQQRQVLETVQTSGTASAINPESLANALRSTSMESMAVALQKARDVAKQVHCSDTDGYENNTLRNNNKSKSATSLGGNSYAYRSKASFKSAKSLLLLSPVKEDGGGQNRRKANAKWTVHANNNNNNNTSMLFPPTTNPLFENAKWQINNPSSDTKMIQPPRKKKYDLSKLAGLVGVPKVKSVPVKILQ